MYLPEPPEQLEQLEPTGPFMNNVPVFRAINNHPGQTSVENNPCGVIIWNASISYVLHLYFVLVFILFLFPLLSSFVEYTIG